jgi:surface antigen
MMRAMSVSKLKYCRVAVTLLLAMSMTSCATIQETYKENPKAVLGTVLGAAAGVAIVAIAGGTPGSMAAAGAAGALVGGYVGKKLDDRDKRMAAQAAQEAFENGATGVARVWSNPDSGNSGSVTPTQTYQIANGQYCRRFTQEFEIGGEKHEDHGTACRNANGVWEVQS